MKFLLGFVFSLLFVSQSHALGLQDAYNAMFRFNHGQGFQNSQLGTKVMRDTVHDAVFQYSFAIDGGAITTGKNLRVPSTGGSPGEASGKLPKGALIIGCYIDVTTAATTSASGTIALTTGKAANDILGATAAASYTGIVACTPTGSAATAIKLTADVTPQYVIATGAITAGKFNLHIQYVLSDM